jgi:hypothetical protein
MTFPLPTIALRCARHFAILAVLLQIIAPVLTVRAAAEVLAAPGWVICSTHDAGQTPDTPAHHQAGLCPMCQFCSVAPLFVAAAPASLAPSRHAIFVGPAAEFFVLARGPPEQRPRSRAPPAIS